MGKRNSQTGFDEGVAISRACPAGLDEVMANLFASQPELVGKETSSLAMRNITSVENKNGL